MEGYSVWLVYPQMKPKSYQDRGSVTGPRAQNVLGSSFSYKNISEIFYWKLMRNESYPDLSWSRVSVGVMPRIDIKVSIYEMWFGEVIWDESNVWLIDNKLLYCCGYLRCEIHSGIANSFGLYFLLFSDTLCSWLS